MTGITDIREMKARIVVFGVGGAGGNAINNKRRVGPMSGQGQSLPKWGVRAMSAFPTIATKLRTSREVRLVPTRDSCSAANRSFIRSLLRLDHLQQPYSGLLLRF